MEDKTRKFSAVYIRNFIFGVEDSLVSTVGLLSGIAAAGISRPAILLTGIILIFVEAFSMAAGSFLSERSTEEYAGRNMATFKSPVRAGLIMFASYFISGFIPLFPYFVMNAIWAFWFSICLSLLSLFILGLVSAKLSGANMFRNALRMLVVGGAAIGIGVFVGNLVR